MTTTEYLELTMDDETDLYNVGRVNANSQKIDRFASSANSQIAALQASVETLGSRCQRLSADLTALTARVEALEGGGT